MSQAFHAIVRGYVQGVSFRYHTKKTAAGLGLTGWVRNLPNGTVEVFAQGDKAPLDQLISWLERGPSYASVDNVAVVWKEPSEDLKRFDISF